MRKLFVTGVCTLMLAASAVSANAQAAPKFAYVNSERLFMVVPGRVEASNQLEKEGLAMQTKFKTMQDSLLKLSEASEKETAALPKAEKLKVLKDTEAKFNEEADKMRADLDQRRGELQQPLQELIQKALEDFRMEGGYMFIFDVASGQGIAAVDKNLDMTERVAARIAKLPAPKITAASDAKPDPAAKKPAAAGPVANPVTPKKGPPGK